ncbi:MAG: sulfite exporter TauE/SafE family protein [Acidobacteria bacterium]|nr:sulfite exporter TauE/SafE family protein [Acidobacteriota bacterium]
MNVSDLPQLLALALAGFVASALNVIAGGGSFLTVPLLIFFGLPATEANATNRLGVLVQNIGGVWGFHRHRVLDWRWALRASLPALAGAVLGTWLALQVGDREFRRILATLMIGVTLWTLLDRGGRLAGALGRLRHKDVVLGAGFALAGVYAGFIQAGVGFFILALVTVGGLDLVRGNAVKVFVILLTTALSLGLFAWEGKVEWVPAIALAAGSLGGSLLGVRLTVLKGHAWVRGVVTAAIVLFAIKLWLG